jgi:hypothetical protein
MTIGYDQPLYVLPFGHRGKSIGMRFSGAERHCPRLSKIAQLEC